MLLKIQFEKGGGYYNLVIIVAIEKHRCNQHVIYGSHLSGRTIRLRHSNVHTMQCISGAYNILMRRIFLIHHTQEKMITKQFIATW